MNDSTYQIGNFNYTSNKSIDNNSGVVDTSFLPVITNNNNAERYVEDFDVNSFASTPQGCSEYVVKEGETLESIANNNNTTIEEIRRLNNMEDYEEVYAGRIIFIPMQDMSMDGAGDSSGSGGSGGSGGSSGSNVSNADNFSEEENESAFNTDELSDSQISSSDNNAVNSDDTSNIIDSEDSLNTSDSSTVPLTGATTNLQNLNLSELEDIVNYYNDKLNKILSKNNYTLDEYNNLVQAALTWGIQNDYTLVNYSEADIIDAYLNNHPDAKKISKKDLEDIEDANKQIKEAKELISNNSSESNYDMTDMAYFFINSSSEIRDEDRTRFNYFYNQNLVKGADYIQISLIYQGEIEKWESLQKQIEELESDSTQICIEYYRDYLIQKFLDENGLTEDYFNLENAADKDSIVADYAIYLTEEQIAEAKLNKIASLLIGNNTTGTYTDSDIENLCMLCNASNYDDCEDIKSIIEQEGYNEETITKILVRYYGETMATRDSCSYNGIIDNVKTIISNYRSNKYQVDEAIKLMEYESCSDYAEIHNYDYDTTWTNSIIDEYLATSYYNYVPSSEIDSILNDDSLSQEEKNKKLSILYFSNDGLFSSEEREKAIKLLDEGLDVLKVELLIYQDRGTKEFDNFVTEFQDIKTSLGSFGDDVAFADYLLSTFDEGYLNDYQKVNMLINFGIDESTAICSVYMSSEEREIYKYLYNADVRARNGDYSNISSLEKETLDYIASLDYYGNNSSKMGRIMSDDYLHLLADQYYNRCYGYASASEKINNGLINNIFDLEFEGIKVGTDQWLTNISRLFTIKDEHLTPKEYEQTAILQYIKGVYEYTRELTDEELEELRLKDPENYDKLMKTNNICYAEYLYQANNLSEQEYNWIMETSKSPQYQEYINSSSFSRWLKEASYEAGLAIGNMLPTMIIQSAGAMFFPPSTIAFSSASGLTSFTLPSMGYIATGVLGSSLMAASVAGGEYGELVRSGLDKDIAYKIAIKLGIADSVSEFVLGTNPFMDNLFGLTEFNNGLLKFLVEVFGEGIQEGAQNLISEYILNTDANLPINDHLLEETWNEIWMGWVVAFQLAGASSAVEISTNFSEALEIIANSNNPQKLISAYYNVFFNTDSVIDMFDAFSDFSYSDIDFLISNIHDNNTLEKIFNNTNNEYVKAAIINRTSDNTLRLRLLSSVDNTEELLNIVNNLNDDIKALFDRELLQNRVDAINNLNHAILYGSDEEIISAYNEAQALYSGEGSMSMFYKDLYKLSYDGLDALCDVMGDKFTLLDAYKVLYSTDVAAIFNSSIDNKSYTSLNNDVIAVLYYYSPDLTLDNLTKAQREELIFVISKIANPDFSSRELPDWANNIDDETIDSIRSYDLGVVSGYLTDVFSSYRSCELTIEEMANYKVVDDNRAASLRAEYRFNDNVDIYEVPVSINGVVINIIVGLDKDSPSYRSEFMQTLNRHLKELSYINSDVMEAMVNFGTSLVFTEDILNNEKLLSVIKQELVDIAKAKGIYVDLSWGLNSPEFREAMSKAGIDLPDNISTENDNFINFLLSNPVYHAFAGITFTYGNYINMPFLGSTYYDSHFESLTGDIDHEVGHVMSKYIYFQTLATSDNWIKLTKNYALKFNNFLDNNSNSGVINLLQRHTTAEYISNPALMLKDLSIIISNAELRKALFKEYPDLVNQFIKDTGYIKELANTEKWRNLAVKYASYINDRVHSYTAEQYVDMPGEFFADVWRLYWYNPEYLKSIDNGVLYTAMAEELNKVGLYHGPFLDSLRNFGLTDEEIVSRINNTDNEWEKAYLFKHIMDKELRDELILTFTDPSVISELFKYVSDDVKLQLLEKIDINDISNSLDSETLMSIICNADEATKAKYNYDVLQDRVSLINYLKNLIDEEVKNNRINEDGDLSNHEVRQRVYDCYLELIKLYSAEEQELLWKDLLSLSVDYLYLIPAYFDLNSTLSDLFNVYSRLKSFCSDYTSINAYNAFNRRVLLAYFGEFDSITNENIRNELKNANRTMLVSLLSPKIQELLKTEEGIEYLRRMLNEDSTYLRDSEKRRLGINDKKAYEVKGFELLTVMEKYNIKPNPNARIIKTNTNVNGVDIPIYLVVSSNNGSYSMYNIYNSSIKDLSKLDPILLQDLEIVLTNDPNNSQHYVDSGGIVGVNNANLVGHCGGQRIWWFSPYTHGIVHEAAHALDNRIILDSNKWESLASRYASRLGRLHISGYVANDYKGNYKEFWADAFEAYYFDYDRLNMIGYDPKTKKGVIVKAIEEELARAGVTNFRQ